MSEEPPISKGIRRGAEFAVGGTAVAAAPVAVAGGAQIVKEQAVVNELKDATELNKKLDSINPLDLQAHAGELDQYYNDQKHAIPEMVKGLEIQTAAHTVADVLQGINPATDPKIQAEAQELANLAAAQVLINGIDNTSGSTKLAAEYALFKGLQADQQIHGDNSVLSQEADFIAQGGSQAGQAVVELGGAAYKGTFENLGPNLEGILHPGTPLGTAEALLLAGGAAIGGTALALHALLPNKKNGEEAHAGNHGAAAKEEADGIRERLAGTHIYEVAGMSAGQLQNTVTQEAAKQAAIQEEGVAVRNQNGIKS